ncbi:unnamed protein product [Mytilus edulis]|uniref:Uncharacterized protein n=1 Tax=Mytilus edulis TaxID=6550 RepID=A0A8S3QXU2_MYTED|nr:unnamed protein product [Mytilus edulis]
MSDILSPTDSLKYQDSIKLSTQHSPCFINRKSVDKTEVALTLHISSTFLRSIEQCPIDIETYAQKALSFTETFGQKPIKVDCKSESGLNVSFKLGENNEPKYSYEKIEAEDKEALKQILFLLDKFCISDAAFHELSMLVDDIPRKYMIVQCRDDINKIYHIERLPDIYTTGKSRRIVLQLKSPEKEGPTLTVKMWGEKAQMPVPVRETSIQLKNIEVINYKGQMEGNST